MPTFPSLRFPAEWTRRIVAAGICLVLLGMTPIGLPGRRGALQAGRSLAMWPAALPMRPIRWGMMTADLYGQSYQPANALYGIANSNIVGQGIGGSSRKFGYLTQADSDYILAIVIEETGIFGPGLHCGRLWHPAVSGCSNMRLRPALCPIRSCSAAALFISLAHFVLNIGGVSALIPLTGVPLLFISNGGTALVSSYLTIGICQNVIANINRKELSSKEE